MIYDLTIILTFIFFLYAGFKNGVQKEILYLALYLGAFFFIASMYRYLHNLVPDFLLEKANQYGKDNYSKLLHVVFFLIVISVGSKIISILQLFTPEEVIFLQILGVILAFFRYFIFLYIIDDILTLVNNFSAIKVYDTSLLVDLVADIKKQLISKMRII